MVTSHATRVLITGATGFIGCHLIRGLSACGAKIAVLEHRRVLPSELAPLVTSRYSCSIEVLADLHKVLNDFAPDAIIHSAACSKPDICESDPELAERVNVLGTENVIAAAMAFAKPPRLISFSSDLVFDGAEEPGENFTGFSELTTPRPSTVYSKSKIRGEQAVISSNLGVVLRLSLVYGEAIGGAGSFLSWILDREKRGQQIPLFVDEWRTPLFVDDLVKVISSIIGIVSVDNRSIFPLKHAFRESVNRGQVFHLGGVERISRYEFGTAMMRECPGLRDKIVPAVRNQFPSLAPRPRDVSLDSTRLWRITGLAPTPVASALADIFSRMRSAPLKIT